MKSFQLYQNNITVPDENISICLGYFDGVHIGHKYLLSCAVKYAKYNVAVLTFDKPISSIIDNDKSKQILTSLNDRFRIVDRLGVDYFYVLHIDENFVNLSKEQFIDLLDKMHVKEIFVGSDYRFGKNRSGSIADLTKHFKVNIVPFEMYKSKKVDVQNIIKLIRNGDIKTANLLLGQNYMVCGTIIKGHQNGSKLGFKTANLKLDSNYVIPRNGVYKTIAYLNGVAHLSLTNVGYHPTIDKEKEIVIETHIPGIDKELYGEVIYIEFLQFIRQEQCFNNVNDLVKQINKDLTLISK